MRLIKEIEIGYFRNFYKKKLKECGDLSLIFGKNDVGKSNIIRALNLFFNNEIDSFSHFEFNLNLSERRLIEAEASNDLRKFIYVKLTIDTPKSFQKSLGDEFYVKRQWSTSRGPSYIQEVPERLKGKSQYVTRLLNKIRFTHVPAVKDSYLFESLLGSVYETLSESVQFNNDVDSFVENVRSSTTSLFSGLPVELAKQSRISAPTQMREMFETLDIETIKDSAERPKSLTLQRGDGVKARHIPDLLKFVSDNDAYDYHIWGFEEPENSLDFVSAEAEASRLHALSTENDIQIFVTTHSPSFYNLDRSEIQKYYLRTDDCSEIQISHGSEINKMDPDIALADGFYLPAISSKLELLSRHEQDALKYKVQVEELTERLKDSAKPVVLTEGLTDAIILREAWEKIGCGDCPFRFESCDTSDETDSDGAAGAEKLAICLKAVRADAAFQSIGLFDRDEAGLKAFRLDKNFRDWQGLQDVQISSNGMSAGLLLTIPSFRKKYIEAKNHTIEHMFPDDALNQPRTQQALQFKKFSRDVKIGSIPFEPEIPDDFAFKKVTGDKKKFATKVVPKLKSAYFESFRQLFGKIARIQKSMAKPK